MSEKKELDEIIEECCTVFRRRQIEGSLPCAKKTLDILRLIVTNKKHSTAAALIDEMRTVGYKMQTARPVELSIGNMARRVLHIIREEAKLEEMMEEARQPAAAQPASTIEAARGQAGGLLSQAFNKGRIQMPRGLSLSNLLDGIDPASFKPMLPAIHESAGGAAAAPPDAARQQPDAVRQAADPAAAPDRPEAEVESAASTRRPRQKAPPNWKGKHEVIDNLNELIDELDHIQEGITQQGVEHIHANEVILTVGLSETTFLFLKEASKKREFQVVVAEGSPRQEGHLMARRLADAGIQTTLIADSAVYAMMARANKVLVGAHAVLANGGVVAPAGMHMAALAAKRHSVPFVVLVGLHKLSPLFPTDPDLLYNEFKGPADVIDFDVLGETFLQQQRHHTAHLDYVAAAAAALDTAAAPGAAPGPALAGAGSSFSDAAPPLAPTGPSASSAASVSAFSASSAFSTAASAATFSPAAPLGGPRRWDPLPGNVHVPTPLFDYVPPHLISLFITDMGGRNPSYVYRLLTEYYSREDYFLSREVFGKDGAR